MAILIVTSCGGSPGATSTAVGLALTWPRSVLLVDADPGAHQSVLAGFLAGQSAQGRGLLRVAEAHRDRRLLDEIVIDQTIALADGDESRRMFLPGFSKPGSAALFTPVWADFATTLTGLGSLGIDVIVDLGRLTTLGVPPPLRDRAAMVAVVVRSHLRSVMSARVHLPALTESDPAADEALGLIVVGPDKPYGPGEIGKVLGLPVLFTLPDDQSAAAHLSDGASRPRRFETSSLVRGLHAATDTLAARLRSADDRLGAQL
jgi:hypothetical protein